MRFDIPDPKVGFLVSGRGIASVGTGGHCGSAVDTLRILAARFLSGVVDALRLAW